MYCFHKELFFITIILLKKCYLSHQLAKQLLPSLQTSGCCSLGWWCCCPTVWTVLGPSIPRAAWSASCRGVTAARQAWTVMMSISRSWTPPHLPSTFTFSADRYALESSIFERFLFSQSMLLYLYQAYTFTNYTKRFAVYQAFVCADQ